MGNHFRAVIFDCFGVLYHDPSKSFYETNIPEYHAHMHDLADLDRQYDYGLISADEHAEAVHELSGLSLDLIRANIRGEHQRNDRLLEFAQGLRPDYKIGMISNIGTGGMESFFSSQERQQYFDDTVLSSDVMLTKPDTEIFRLAAERLGFRPDECIMIDDRRDNIEGAERAGMHAILHLSTPHTIHSVQELRGSA